MIRTAAKLSAVALFSIVTALGTTGLADDAKCTIATKTDTTIGQACAKGGRGEAKKVMKEMVKVAKTNGQKFTCDGCHKDLDSYALTKNGAEDFKKLEAAQKK